MARMAFCSLAILPLTKSLEIKNWIEKMAFWPLARGHLLLFLLSFLLLFWGWGVVWMFMIDARYVCACNLTRLKVFYCIQIQTGSD